MTTDLKSMTAQEFLESLVKPHMTANPDLNFMTPDELAERLRVSRQTVNRWRVSGDGPPFTKVANQIYYPVADLVQWEKSRPVVTSTAEVWGMDDAREKAIHTAVLALEDRKELCQLCHGEGFIGDADCIHCYGKRNVSRMSAHGEASVHIDAYEAALWQPIETAPKDGTPFDVWHRNGTRFTDCIWADWFGQEGIWHNNGVTDCYLPCDQLSCWRPIPEVPSEGDEG